MLDSQRIKLDVKAKKCNYVGYERRKDRRRVDLASHKIIVSRDMVYDKVSSYYGANGIPLEQEKLYIKPEVSSSLDEQGE